MIKQSVTLLIESSPIQNYLYCMIQVVVVLMTAVSIVWLMIFCKKRQMMQLSKKDRGIELNTEPQT